MKTKRFQKGQTVYQVGVWSETAIQKSNGKTCGSYRIEIRIHARVVDACGAKQITFYPRVNERGVNMDCVFGKKLGSDCQFLYADKTAAISAAHQMAVEQKAANVESSKFNEWYSTLANNEYIVNETIFEG